MVGGAGVLHSPSSGEEVTGKGFLGVASDGVGQVWWLWDSWLVK